MAKLAVGAASIVLAAASAFFAYYTIRLAYVSLTIAGNSRVSRPGMLIGAMAFPMASAVFGYLSWRCVRIVSSK